MTRRVRKPAKPVRMRRRPVPGAAPFFLAATRWKSIVTGVLGTLVVHVALMAVLPDRLTSPRSGEQRAARSIDFVFPEPEEEVPEPLPEEYVATNPDVPSNPPDETRNFASRDQQAAQEEPPESETPEETPRVEGEELRSQNIVEGNPEPALPQGGGAPSERELARVEDFPAVPERRPVPGLDDPEPDPEESGVAAEADVEEPGDDETRTIGINVPDEQRMSPDEATRRASAERPRPSPRPTLPRTHSAPVAERPGTSSRLGEIAIDARRSEFGSYLERMLEAIERQWHSLARSHAGVADSASRVRIRFKLDAAGHVEILEVDSSASHTGTLICQDAIEARAPFGDWSEDMISVLGDEQTMTITFHYR